MARSICMYEEPSFQCLPPQFLGELPGASWVQRLSGARQEGRAAGYGQRTGSETRGPVRLLWAARPGVPRWDPGRGMLYER